MHHFTDFLKNYRRRVDEGEPPSNGVGGSIAKPEGGPSYDRTEKNGRPHYVVSDETYRSIRHGKKKFTRWDKYIQNDESLCSAMRECLSKHGSITVESKTSGQTVRLKK